MAKGSVKVDSEKCKGCLLCVDACPAKVLEASSEANSSGSFPVRVARGEDCLGCAACWTVCPDVALTVVKE